MHIQHTIHACVCTLWQEAAKDGDSQGTPECSYEQRDLSTVHMGDFPDKLLYLSPGLVCFKNPHEGPDTDVATMKSHSCMEEMLLFLLT